MPPQGCSLRGPASEDEFQCAAQPTSWARPLALGNAPVPQILEAQDEQHHCDAAQLRFGTRQSRRAVEGSDGDVTMATSNSTRLEKHSTGIYARHARTCEGTIAGKDCKCGPKYQATFWNARTKRRHRKHFGHVREAQAWRADLISASHTGKTIVTASRVTVGEALDAYIAGMLAGTILNRSDRPYKPSACRGYRRAAERLKAEIGHIHLTELRRRDINEMVARLRAQDLSASTIRNTFDPLRAMYRKAIDDETVVVDPTYKLRLPSSANDERTRRSVSPVDAERLVDALPAAEQALWATAIYVGLRRGELQELRWSDIDLDAGIGHCARAWDDEGRQVIETKSRAGKRMFPLVAPVRRRLVAHKLLSGRGGTDLVFGRSTVDRFVPSTVRRRAIDAWKIAGLQPISLHEGRHSAATAGSAAGLDDLALSRIMGHSSVTITRDVYGHMREDRIAEVTKTLDAYYEEANRA